MMLEARQIDVRVRGQRLLEVASLGVCPGEVLCMVGPNGAGKSTLLGVLSGARAPSSGNVTLDGLALASWEPGALARRRAVLPQQSALSFPLTVIEVVLLGRTPFAGHANRRQDLAHVEAALEETATAHLAERRYTTLSGGERQRVQLARVLAQIGFARCSRTLEGRYLLLDEPTASLDLAHQHACLRTARCVAQRGGAVLAIVHDPNLAFMYADRVAMLAGGRLLGEGAATEIVTAASLREVFSIDAAILRHPERDCPFAVPL